MQAVGPNINGLGGSGSLADKMKSSGSGPPSQTAGGSGPPPGKGGGQAAGSAAPAAPGSRPHSVGPSAASQSRADQVSTKS